MSYVKKWEEFRYAENSFGEKNRFFLYPDSEYFRSGQFEVNVEHRFNWTECTLGALKRVWGIDFEAKSIYVPVNGFKSVKFLIVTPLL